MSLPPDVIQAVEKWGPHLDKLAKSRYGIDGTTLLAKLIQGESGGRPNQTSSAGAKGYAQFMPSTRQGVIQRFGIDPWRSADEAAHAAVLHLTGRLGNQPGLQGYNPGGGQSYVHYILGQKVSLPGSGSRSAPNGVSGAGTIQTTFTPATMPTTSTALADLLKATVSNKGGVGMIAPPSFAAQPHLPKGAPQLPSVGGGGGVSQGVTDAIQQAMGLRGPEPATVTTTGPTTSGVGVDLPNPVPLNGKRVSLPTTYGGVTTVFHNVLAGVPKISNPNQITRLHGLAAFDGKPVAAWIAPILAYAKSRGWSGTVSEGARSYNQQASIYNSGVRPAAKPGTSNHEFQIFPGGAVDVTNAPQLSAILQQSPYRNLLVWAGAKDKVHFSHPHNGSY